MKIGELAQLCGVPQATIRYYVRTGMLVPNDSGSQYNFTEREYQNLRLILKMKQQQFNLKEIQDYLVLTRHSNFIEPDTISACLAMLNGKRQELSQEITRLQQSIQDIDQEILELNSRGTQPPDRTGVPLSALSLLVCPHCGQRLKVDNASLIDDFIYSGTLSCPNTQDCPQGYHALIEHGIVKTGNLYDSSFDAPDLSRGLYRDMVPAFSSALQKCYDFVCDELQKSQLHGKVILEANINGYFFLYHHLNLLPEDCICIVIDKYPEILEMYKSLIEQMHLNRQILYIADASREFPLRPACVDLHISYLGETEYQLYHPNTFLHDAKPYLKPDVKVLGTYLSFDRSAVSRKNLIAKYPEGSDRRHQVNYLREDYEAAGFHVELTEAGVVLDSGSRQYSFDCHVPGEPLRVFRFTASPASSKRPRS